MRRRPSGRRMRLVWAWGFSMSICQVGRPAWAKRRRRKEELVADLGVVGRFLALDEFAFELPLLAAAVDGGDAGDQVVAGPVAGEEAGELADGGGGAEGGLARGVGEGGLEGGPVEGADGQGRAVDLAGEASGVVEVDGAGDGAGDAGAAGLLDLCGATLVGEPSPKRAELAQAGGVA